MRLLLTLVDGEEIEYKMEKDSVSIGRSSQCDLVITHESMSRQHCKLEFKDGEMFITDLGSINGVYIDGKKIPPNSSVPFHTYLHLAFGYVTSAQLMMDDATKIGVLNSFSAGSGSAKATSSSSPNIKSEVSTKTKTVHTARAQAALKKSPAATEKSGKNALAINALAFVAVLGALYYFLYAGKETSNTPETTPQTKNQPKPVDSSDHF